VGSFDQEDDDGDAGDDFSNESQRKRPRMQGWVQQRFVEHHPICSDAIEAFGLMHRLDIQTSGILLCAKNYVGAYWLRLQWCSYAVDKEYVCLVHGWVDRSIREVHKRIRVDKKKAPNSRKTVSTHCSVNESGKPSYTEVYTAAHLISRPSETSADAADSSSDAPASGNSDGKYSLVVLKLHTGRTHQIRVHMLSLGHPLVADVKYAESLFPEDSAWCPRNFLHTYRLAVADVPAAAAQEVNADAESAASARGPATEGSSDTVEIMCPLPRDLRSALSKLEPARPDDGFSQAAYDSWLGGDSKDLRPFDDLAPPLPEQEEKQDVA